MRKSWNYLFCDVRMKELIEHKYTIMVGKRPRQGDVFFLRGFSWSIIEDGGLVSRGTRPLFILISLLSLFESPAL